MSLISHTLMPRSSFNMDDWMLRPILDGSNTLDAFDPFDELDNVIARNMQWLNKPEFIKTFDFPTVPQKYRITIDISGYNPKLIKTEWKNNQFIVSGREEVKHEGDDFSVKEFKKTYELPANAEHDKLVSFATPNGQLVLEFPLKDAPTFQNAELFPQVLDLPNGEQQVWLNTTLPPGIDANKVHVTCKDRDVIIKAEDIRKKPDGISKMHYYKRATMPANTNWKMLHCTFDKNMLEIKAPLDLSYKPHAQRNVPIKWLKDGAPFAVGSKSQ